MVLCGFEDNLLAYVIVNKANTMQASNEITCDYSIATLFISTCARIATCRRYSGTAMSTILLYYCPSVVTIKHCIYHVDATARMYQGSKVSSYDTRMHVYIIVPDHFDRGRK